LTELYPYLTDNFGNDWYPELKARADTIKSIIHSEETIFLATLDKGLGLLESVFSQPNLQTAKEIPAETAFKLYDTYGFPLDLTTIIAAERGWHINLAGTYSTNWMHATIVSVNLIVSLHFASCRG
jgi:alanyl-tRNA synthetase